MACRRLGAIVLLLLAACSSDGGEASTTTTTSTTTSSATVAPSTCPDRVDLSYGDAGDPQRRLDLFRPAGVGCQPVPVVVWVHGGGWQAGDKANQIDPKVALWNNAGWAVASVNYRLTDLAVPEPERVLAPDHNEDVAAAVAFLVAEADALGIDADRLALLGHSAGAGIVAALATDPRYLGAHDLEPSALACVAPLDTEGFDIAAVVEGGGQIATLYRSVFGEDPAGWDELSPLTHVGEAAVPDLFLVARGTPERRAQVAAFAGAVEGAGGAVTVVDVSGYSHGDVNRRIGDPTDELLTPPMQAFLASCLAP
ncbi:MAG: alpha/beta hydrolase fold domain-containing protein [Acidimicrobiales bacterium]